MRNELFRALYSARNISIAHNYTAYLWRLEVHPHTFRGCIQVHSGTFRYMQVHSGTFRCIQVHSLTFMYIRAHPVRSPMHAPWVLSHLGGLSAAPVAIPVQQRPLHPLVLDYRVPAGTTFSGVSGRRFRAFPGISSRFPAFPVVYGRKSCQSQASTIAGMPWRNIHFYDSAPEELRRFLRSSWALL